MPSLLALLLAITTTAVRSDDELEIYNSEKGEEPFLSAEKACESISLPPGFSARVFASEPDLRQPIAMTLDARGRLWVAENYTYAERELNFDTRLHDRILILEDRDHDGRFDRRKVFWDRAQKLAGVEVGFGGVWALCAPQFLFIPDRDGDDVPDGEPRVVLDGWDDGEVRHNLVNGLRWGPDGWLYGRHGIQATSRVGAPGAPARKRTEMNCGIWRFHPVREDFEVVVHGTTNPWGHDWDDHGQLFFINTVIGHLWHVVPGAHYERMYGQDFNAHIYELLPQTADHYHWDRREKWSDLKREGLSDASSRAGGGHAHSGLMIYLGDNWPPEYRNDVFAVNYHGRRVNRDHLERRGAGYTATHRPDPIRVGDLWFRGLDLIYGPDGGVYLSDWSDVGECHDTDGVHRTSGRIYKITHGEPAVPELGDLARRSDAELVRLQLQRNDWWVRQSRRILQERAASGRDMGEAARSLRKLFDDQPEVTRKLRALWCLHGIGAADEAWLVELLAHQEEHVRVWAVQLLVDRGAPQREAIAALGALARDEESGLVQLFLASAMQRLPHADRWDIAEHLASRDTFAGDPVLPLMIWYGIEAAVADSPGRAAALIQKSRLPRLRRFVARRLAEATVERRAGGR